MPPVGFLQPAGQLLHHRPGQLAGQGIEVAGDQAGSGHGPPSSTALTVAANSRQAARLARQGLLAGCGEPVAPPPPSAHHRPCPGDQPALLQPAQRRVDGPGRQVQPPAGVLPQRLDHRVPVPRAGFQRGQQQRVQVPLQLLGPHK